MKPVTEGMPTRSAALKEPVASPPSSAHPHARHSLHPGRCVKGGQQLVKAVIVTPLAGKLWLAAYRAEEARERSAQQRRYLRSAAWSVVLALLGVVGQA